MAGVRASSRPPASGRGMEAAIAALEGNAEDTLIVTLPPDLRDLARFCAALRGCRRLRRLALRGLRTRAAAVQDIMAALESNHTLEVLDLSFNERAMPGALGRDARVRADAGYVGFDPLGFSTLGDVKFLREAEVKHGRVAMLAAAGAIAQDLYHFPVCMHSCPPEEPQSKQAREPSGLVRTGCREGSDLL